MFRPSSFLTTAVRATALTTIVAVASASSAQAAVTVLRPANAVIRTTTGIRPANARVGSPQWILSHLGAYHTPPRNAAISNATGTTYPLDGPFGLTVAPNGDLYAANLLSNKVLVYGSNLVQKTGSAISAGLSGPTDVAFDSTGEVYVSNFASSLVTVYSANHTFLPSRSLSASVNKPVSIAIDGIDNLFVDENYGAIGLYSPSGAYQGNIGPTPAVNAIAERGHLFAEAFSYAVASAQTEQEIFYAVYGTGFTYGGEAANDPLAIAFDSNNNVYAATDDPAVVFINPQTGATQRLFNMGFVPQGIAVDRTHNHIFVSDYSDNAIMVYNLAGGFVTTLH